LAGFTFQLANALLALVKSPPEQRRPALLIEALSDLVVNDGGLMVVTQCKLTLGSDALRKALDELWSIDVLACRDVPELVPKLRYAVLASRTKLADFESVIRAWSPQSSIATERLSEFRERVSVRFEPAPWNALIRHLANAFGHTTPLETAARWLGWLMVHPSAEGMEQICNDILVELASIEATARSNEVKFLLFGFDDLPPDDVLMEPDPLKATIAGAMPRISDLKQGRFAKRRLYEEICAAVEGWLISQQSASEGMLSSYCITGRSGAGKSVALLHLLADMYVKDPDRVIIPLGKEAYRLPEALSWARPFFANHRQVIIAADDPYTSEQADEVRRASALAVRELNSIRAAYPNAPAPLFVFCAPTEQFEAFRDDVSELLSFESYTLCRETKADIEELKLWYQLRTGKTELPIGEAENILLVQIFFEWRTGFPIKEFARRFRIRLNSMLQGRSDLFDMIAEVLALNRLYALFPAQALERRMSADVELATAFDRLCQEDQHFASDTEIWGYRMTHPHLADAIYTSWFGRPIDRRYRELHLKRGIEAALETGLNSSSRFAPLWAISRLSRGRTDEEAKFDGATTRLALIQLELQQYLPQLYAKLRADGGSSTLEWLPVWTDLDASLNLNLQPPPIQQTAATVESAQNRARGLRLACHKLLQHASALPIGPPIVAARLKQDPEWSEWGALAIDFVRTIGVGNMETAICEHVTQKPEWQDTHRLINGCLCDPAGREIVLSWLATARQTMPAWPSYYTRFIDEFGHCDHSKEIGVRYLETQFDNDSWSHIWERCLSPQAIDILVLGLDWLEKASPAASGWDRVWERVWDLVSGNEGGPEALQRIIDVANLRAIGRRWLDLVDADHGSWPFVWERLWEASGKADNDLKARARQWLGQTKLDHGSWGFVWAELWQTSGKADNELKVRARQWLDQANPQNGSWAFVWEKLWEASGKADIDLKARARQWLDQTKPDHGSWGFVWEKLWEASGKADIDLKARARKWLDQANPQNASWPFIWEKLWEDSGKTDNELIARARQRLDQAKPDTQAWGIIWAALWEDSGKADNELKARARQWIDQAKPDHQSWGIIWAALWEASGKTDNELKAQARQWLDQAKPDHQAWGFIWPALWEASGKADIDLKARARQWLDQAKPDHQAWGIIWAALWEASGKADNELKARARQWLDQAKPDHQAWGIIWAALWEASGKADNELKARARQWLDQAKPDHQAWGFIWPALWEASGKADNELKARARQWLDQAKFNHQAWGFIWPALWEASGKADDELKARARQWLDQIKPDHQAWGIIWAALWEASGKADNELKARARQWIDQAKPDHQAWGIIWAALWEASGKTDNELKAQARQWLDQAKPDHQAWGFIWPALWEASGKADNELKAWARQWLDQAKPDHQAWGIIWAALWEASGKADNELKARARQWLDQAKPDHQAWGIIWAALWEASGKADNELKARARQWLDQAKPDHQSWGFIWTALWEASGKTDNELKARARQWLDQAKPDHHAWGFIWPALWEASGKADNDLKERARHWLDQAKPDHHAWGFIWPALWEASGKADNDLKERARHWLDQAKPDHGSWQYVWKELWQASGKADNDLKERARHWLDQAKPDHGSWQYVWKELWQASGKADNDLKERARHWLNHINLNHRSWRYLWVALWEASCGQDQELRSHGKNWLRIPRSGWIDVWKLLWRASDSEERVVLAQSAIFWLGSAEVPSEWPAIWHILWNESKLETKVLAVCAERLLLTQHNKGADDIRLSLKTARFRRE
jgi:hypothetical protein